MASHIYMLAQRAIVHWLNDDKIPIEKLYRYALWLNAEIGARDKRLGYKPIELNDAHTRSLAVLLMNIQDAIEEALAEANAEVADDIEATAQPPPEPITTSAPDSALAASGPSPDGGVKL